MQYKMWNEFNYPFPNFDGCTTEVWEWIRNRIPHFIGHVIIHAMLGLKLNHISKSGPNRYATSFSTIFRTMNVNRTCTTVVGYEMDITANPYYFPSIPPNMYQDIPRLNRSSHPN